MTATEIDGTKRDLENDLIERLRDHALYNKQERCAMFKEAADEIERLRGCGWQPIETAPRDGTIILLGNYGSEPRPAYYGRALKAFNACAEPRFPWVFLDSTNGVNAMTDDETGATHWMPLPNPPETTP